MIPKIGLSVCDWQFYLSLHHLIPRYPQDFREHFHGRGGKGRDSEYLRLRVLLGLLLTLLPVGNILLGHFLPPLSQVSGGLLESDHTHWATSCNICPWEQERLRGQLGSAGWARPLRAHLLPVRRAGRRRSGRELQVSVTWEKTLGLNFSSYVNRALFSLIITYIFLWTICKSVAPVTGKIKARVTLSAWVFEFVQYKSSYICLRKIDVTVSTLQLKLWSLEGDFS